MYNREHVLRVIAEKCFHSWATWPVFTRSCEEACLEEGGRGCNVFNTGGKKHVGGSGGGIQNTALSMMALENKGIFPWCGRALHK